MDLISYRFYIKMEGHLGPYILNIIMIIKNNQCKEFQSIMIHFCESEG